MLSEARKDRTESQLKLLVNKYDIAANYYANLSPAISRELNRRSIEQKQMYNDNVRSLDLSCQFCHTLFHPDNHTVRFTARKKPARNMQKIVRKVAEKGKASLGKMEKSLLLLHARESAETVIRCHGCCKKSTFQRSGKPAKAAKELTSKDEKREEVKSKKKKKKKKEANAGLSIDGSAKKTEEILESTPKAATQPVKVATKVNVPLTAASISSILHGVKDNPIKKNSNQKARNKEKRNILQGMLAKASKESKKEAKGGLQSFLSSL